jgi:hypothetical protein
MMSENPSILQFVRENKTLLILIGVGLFLIELEIFAIAAMRSGREARLQVLNNRGDLIYEADGTQLTEFNKYYFEKTFGPLENHQTRLVTSVEPFPFRAWFAAAIGVPVGAILLFGFAVRAYMALFYPEAGSRPGPAGAPDESETRFEKVIRKVSQFNIFVIGALTFLTAVTVWMLPNMLQRIGIVGVETIIKYKWVVLGAVGVILALVIWIIYLRYLLARKTIESHVEVDKFRLQLEMAPENRQMILLPPGKAPDSNSPPLVEFEKDPADKNRTDGKQT